MQKRSTSILQVLTMSSPDGRYDTIYISNYALVNVLDEIRRLPGVGDASLFGASDYSMRIWLRPDKLAQYNLTPSDIAAVVREQNQQFAAGRFGEEPMNKPQVFTYSVTTPPRLVDRTQFEDIIIRSEENGGALRLKDVARVELGALLYGFSGTFNGSPAVPIAVYLQPGANALQVAAAVKDDDGDASPSASRSGCATTSRSTRRASSRSRSRRSPSPSSRRSCWSCWWSSCSCRACGR